MERKKRKERGRRKKGRKDREEEKERLADFYLIFCCYLGRGACLDNIGT